MIEDTTAPAGALPPLAPPVLELERLLQLRPGQLQPSPTNPRKRFDTARVQQIADSMDEVGQIQPIRARPNPAFTPSNGRPPYEIVIGETRWRAAQVAKKTPVLDIETLARFGQLLVAELQERVADVAELPLIVLRLMVDLLFEDMVFEEAELLYTTCGWDIDDAVKGAGLAVDFEQRVNAADGRTLGELLALCLVVPDGTNNMGPEQLRGLRKSPAVALAKHFGIDLDRVLRDARTAMRAQAIPGEDPSTLQHPTEVAKVILSLVAPDYAETGKLFDMRQGRLLDYRLPE